MKEKSRKRGSSKRNRQNGLCTSWKKNSRLRQDDEVNSMSRLRNRKWKEVKKAAP